MLCTGQESCLSLKFIMPHEMGVPTAAGRPSLPITDCLLSLFLIFVRCLGSLDTAKVRALLLFSAAFGNRVSSILPLGGKGRAHPSGHRFEQTVVSGFSWAEPQVSAHPTSLLFSRSPLLTQNTSQWLSTCNCPRDSGPCSQPFLHLNGDLPHHSSREA